MYCTSPDLHIASGGGTDPLYLGNIFIYFATVILSTKQIKVRLTVLNISLIL